ncbi:CoA transferase [Streptomyces sp. NPDC048629]|uniref:CaiB/BaiF CoA transferase family protein n=1 Tax=Streptomyces sp. NPDC048629 TaxID=3154824 RepID=UPI00343CBF85
MSGVRVVDLTSVFMGPLASQLLGDLGADVIKVEGPGGDTTRGMGPRGDAGLGPVFLGLNRNKRSVTLDLKREPGRQVLFQLVESADVLLYNVRPAAMARLGLGYEEVRGRNPKIIYAGLVGFSQRGPYAPRAAFDDLIQAASGLSGAIGLANAGVPGYVPVALADRAVGLFAFGVIAAALHGRATTGRGCQVDIPMFETMVSVVLGDHLYGETFVPAQGPMGYPRLLSPDRRPYRTRDGYLCCTVYTDANWRNFLRVIGRESWFETDPRFATFASRTQHIDELYALVGDELAKRDTAEWVRVLDEVDIPTFPVHTLDSLRTDDHLRATGFFREVEHPVVGTIQQMSHPVEWDGAVPEPARLAPTQGEHTREVLAELGYTAAEIDALIASHAAGETAPAPAGRTRPSV